MEVEVVVGIGEKKWLLIYWVWPLPRIPVGK